MYSWLEFGSSPKPGVIVYAHHFWALDVIPIIWTRIFQIWQSLIGSIQGFTSNSNFLLAMPSTTHQWHHPPCIAKAREELAWEAPTWLQQLWGSFSRWEEAPWRNHRKTSSTTCHFIVMETYAQSSSLHVLDLILLIKIKDCINGRNSFVPRVVTTLHLLGACVWSQSSLLQCLSLVVFTTFVVVVMEPHLQLCSLSFPCII